MEDAIASETAVCQRLGIVLEGIGRRFRTTVRDRQSLVVLYKDKLNFCAVALDRTGLNVPRDAQALGVGGVSHTTQFLDGDVVTLAFLDASVSQVSEH